MPTTTSVFLNGLAGVFTGIAVLYVMMRALAALAGRPPSAAAPPAPKTD